MLDIQKIRKEKSMKNNGDENDDASQQRTWFREKVPNIEIDLDWIEEWIDEICLKTCRASIAVTINVKFSHNHGCIGPLTPINELKLSFIDSAHLKLSKSNLNQFRSRSKNLEQYLSALEFLLNENYVALILLICASI